jgi:hypothetical protein
MPAVWRDFVIERVGKLAGAEGVAGPSTRLRLAQDDGFLGERKEDGGGRITSHPSRRARWMGHPALLRGFTENGKLTTAYGATLVAVAKLSWWMASQVCW